MCPPAASLPSAIDIRCTGEEVFIHFKRMMSGSPLPENVRIDVNPYHFLPSSDFTVQRISIALGREAAGGHMVIQFLFRQICQQEISSRMSNIKYQISNIKYDALDYPETKRIKTIGDIWFLSDSKESKDSKHGFWKAKVDASKIFSDPEITGWMITFEFYEGQFPNCHKSNWVMREYTMTFKGPCEDSKATILNIIFNLVCR